MFAQLINVDYFEDLLNVLQNIAKTQYDAYVTGKLNSNSAPVCALHCVIAAFELLESLKNTLSVDLRDFYCSFYTQMMRMTARTSSAENVVVAKSNHSRNENELMLRGIDMMMKKKIDIPNERVAAFVKRLGILSLSSPANAAAAYISAIHWAFVRYPRFQCFVEEDGRIGTGCFEAFVDDPDLCNPFASSLWDLQLLSV